jgi:hypothetical protein
MTSLVFHPRPKSVPIGLLTIFSAPTLYAGAPAQTLSEGLGQAEMEKVRTPINGGVDVNRREAGDTTLRRHHMRTRPETLFLLTRCFQ